MRGLSFRWFAPLLTCLLLVPTFVAAQTEADSLEAPPQIRRDRGFVLRVTAGPAFGSGLDSSFSGPGADASLAIGGFITHTVALHATVLGTMLFPNSGDAEFVEQDFSSLGGGVGVTYFRESGVYGSFSFMAGAQKLSKEDSWRSDTTLAELLIGREWGQGKLYYGVAFGFIGAIAGGENSDAQTSASASIRFSMTLR